MTTSTQPPKCNKKNMRLWVKELRSGKYLQTKGELRGKRLDGKIGYCCLGVAQCAFRKATNRHDVSQNGGHLALVVQNWLGLKEPNPVIAEGNEVWASWANDSLGWSFAEIADSIESFYQLKRSQ